MYNFCKRLFDILVSFTVLVVLSPLLIPVSLGLLLTGEHYVFYFQRRIGYKNKPFDIWKFATMLKNSPNIGMGLLTTRNDPRILPMGGFLRKTKINELPQLINILKGDMSIVGPRPMVDKTFAAYPENIRYLIYDSKPGLTGIGSVVFRDEEDYLTRAKNPSAFFEGIIQPFKGELEMWYRERKSLWVDFLIIFLTAWAIIKPQNELVYTVFSDLPRKDMEKELDRFNEGIA